MTCGSTGFCEGKGRGKGRGWDDIIRTSMGVLNTDLVSGHTQTFRYIVTISSKCHPSRGPVPTPVTLTTPTVDDTCRSSADTSGIPWSGGSVRLRGGGHVWGADASGDRHESGGGGGFRGRYKVNEKRAMLWTCRSSH